LRIGYYTDDGLFPTCKAIRKAILEAADGLRKRGHEVTEFKPKNTKELMSAYFAEFAAVSITERTGQWQSQ